MNRKQAREFVMQTIFQIEIKMDFDKPDIEKYMTECSAGNQKDYIRNLLSEICSNLGKIDGIINAASDGWPSSRMSKPDLAVIRVAVGEILFADDVPATVAINEAVNLAKDYGTEQSPKFVNGVLAKVSKQLL